jgi:hypothetical protein
MSACLGDVSVGTKADREMADFLRDRANVLGVTQSELIRRLFEHYRDGCHGDLVCPHCTNELRVRL